MFRDCNADPLSQHLHLKTERECLLCGAPGREPLRTGIIESPNSGNCGILWPACALVFGGYRTVPCPIWSKGSVTFIKAETKSQVSIGFAKGVCLKFGPHRAKQFLGAGREEGRSRPGFQGSLIVARLKRQAIHSTGVACRMPPTRFAAPTGGVAQPFTKSSTRAARTMQTGGTVCIDRTRKPKREGTVVT